MSATRLSAHARLARVLLSRAVAAGQPRPRLASPRSCRPAAAAGKLIIGYENWGECDPVNVIQTAKDGMNVIIWRARQPICPGLRPPPASGSADAL